MRDFWSSIVLMSSTYKGKPIMAHMPLGLRPTHFARRLHLFEQLAKDVSLPHAAQHFIDRAHGIAHSLRRGLGIAESSADAVADPSPERMFTFGRSCRKTILDVPDVSMPQAELEI